VPLILGGFDLLVDIVGAEHRRAKLATQRQAQVEIGADTHLDGSARHDEVEHVATARAIVGDEVHVTTGNTNAFFVQRTLESDQFTVQVGELHIRLPHDGFFERQIRFRLLGDGAGRYGIKVTDHAHRVEIVVAVGTDEFEQSGHIGWFINLDQVVGDEVNDDGKRRDLCVVYLGHRTVRPHAQALAIEHDHFAVERIKRSEPNIAVREQFTDRQVAFIHTGKQRTHQACLEHAASGHASQPIGSVQSENGCMTDPLTRHTDYGQRPLLETEVLDDPIAQARLWLAQADESKVYEPNAMVLSTIDPDGLPSSRTVLLRALDENGLEFFTNYTSEKGRALLAHPEVSVVFPWYLIHRQIIVRGIAEPTDPAVSDAYFASRPKGSQIAAVASDQSQPIASRDLLEQKVRDLEALYGDGDVSRPDTWGGFRIHPSRIEFWQGRSSRMHDRLRFSAGDDGTWNIQRLQP
jgi:pyridoxamine 5'-phosphate oxidase